MDTLVPDFSNYDAPTFDPSCFYAAGVRRAIVGCQREPIARDMLTRLRTAGTEIPAVYGFHYFGAAGGQAHEIVTAITLAHEFDVPLVFIDCELDAQQAGWGEAPPTIGQRVAQIAQSVERVQDSGLNAGIYTGAWWWRPQTANSLMFAHLPLWHSAYGKDSGPLDPVTEVSYGGWSAVWAHQYTSTYELCGRGRDMNYLYQVEDAMTPAELARLERLERIVAANGISTAGTGTIDKQGEDALAYADERGWSAFLGVNLARTEAQTAQASVAGHASPANHPGVGASVPDHTHEPGGVKR